MEEEITKIIEGHVVVAALTYQFGIMAMPREDTPEARDKAEEFTRKWMNESAKALLTRFEKTGYIIVKKEPSYDERFRQ